MIHMFILHLSPMFFFNPLVEKAVLTLRGQGLCRLGPGPKIISFLLQASLIITITNIYTIFTQIIIVAIAIIYVSLPVPSSLQTTYCVPPQFSFPQTGLLVFVDVSKISLSSSGSLRRALTISSISDQVVSALITRQHAIFFLSHHPLDSVY